MMIQSCMEHLICGQGDDLWSLNNRQQLLIYGEDTIQVLSQYFEALLNQQHFNLQSCLDEWMQIKMHLQRERTNL